MLEHLYNDVCPAIESSLGWNSNLTGRYPEMFVLRENKTHVTGHRTQFLGAGTVTLLALALVTPDVRASDDTPTRSVELRLVDENQEPISGASVTAVGLSVKDRAAGYWETGRNTEPTQRSDDLGRVVVEVPTQRRLNQTVTAVVCHISHPDFVTINTPASFKDSPATLRLVRGRRIAASAVDSHTGTRIKHNLFATLSKCFTNQEWQLLSNGVVVSEGVAFDRTHLRLIHLPEDGVPQFSRLIDLTKHGKNRRILLHDMEVRAGLRLEGTLDRQVPRPIRNGIISVLVSEGRNDWQDGCDIQPDGSFVIDALPRGEVIQLTAVCDGWVSANPSKEELTAVGMTSNVRRLQPSRLYPQVLRSEETLLETVVRMESAASCRVLVEDTSGNPIQNAIVRLQPFQGSFDGRSVLIGQFETTRGFLTRRQFEPAAAQQQSIIKGSLQVSPPRDYSAVTNNEGIATVTSLPGGPDGSPAMTSVYVSHSDYERPPNDGLGDRGLSRAALYQGQTAELKFQLKKKQP